MIQPHRRSLPRQPGTPLRRLRTGAAVALLWIAAAGCGDRQAGVALARAGAESAAATGDYYDALVADVLTIWELEAFLGSLRGSPFAAEQEDALRGQVEALRQRSRAARRLASAYSALGSLAGGDPGARVGEAAGELAAAVHGITPLPATRVDPVGSFGALATELSRWQQSRELRKGGALLFSTVAALRDLFQAELVAYASIPEERGSKTMSVIEHLVRNRMVVAWPLLQAVPASLGLAWTADKKPIDDAATAAAAIELARVRTTRAAVLSSSAGEAVLASLTSLAETHERFRAGRDPGVEELLAAVQKARVYLDDIRRQPATGGRP